MLFNKLLQKIIVSLVLLVLFPATLFASAYNVKVSGISVSAKSAVEAKKKGFEEATNIALKMLLNRISLSNLTNHFDEIWPEKIEELVAGYSVSNEKTSSTSYLADITIKFNPKFVKHYTSEKNIPIVDRQAPLRLVIPVLQKEDKNILWQNKSPWYLVWQLLDTQNSLTPFILINNDESDKTISFDKLVEYDPMTMSNLASKYVTDSVVIAQAVIDDEGVSFSIKSGNSEAFEDISFNDKLMRNKKETDHALLFRASSKILSSLEDHWKIGRFENKRKQVKETVPIPILVPIKNIQDWVKVRGLLESFAEIDRLDIKSINVKRAQIIAHYDGELSILVDRLYSHGYVVSNNGNYWLIQQIERLNGN